jgi:hypothetical protein
MTEILAYAHQHPMWTWVYIITLGISCYFAGLAWRGK